MTLNRQDVQQQYSSWYLSPFVFLGVPALPLVGRGRTHDSKLCWYFSIFDKTSGTGRLERSTYLEEQ